MAALLFCGAETFVQFWSRRHHQEQFCEIILNLDLHVGTFRMGITGIETCQVSAHFVVQDNQRPSRHPTGSVSNGSLNKNQVTSLPQIRTCPSF